MKPVSYTTTQTVLVIDETGIREVPPEVMERIAARMDELMAEVIYGGPQVYGPPAPPPKVEGAGVDVSGFFLGVCIGAVIFGAGALLIYRRVERLGRSASDSE